MIIDGHSDILIDVSKYWHSGHEGRLIDYHVPKMSEGGVSGAWCPVSVDNPSHPGDPYERMLRTLDAVHAEVELAAGAVELVDDARSFEAAMLAGRIALFLGIEGASPVAGQAGRVEEFKQLGLHWFGLTWNAPNEMGDGLGVSSPRGLTAVGKEVVAEMERSGVIIDLTHASVPLFESVVASSQKPFAVTHSNARELCDHVRNLTASQLESVKQRNGIVGVNFFPALLTLEERPATMDDIVRHASYLKQSVGQLNVTLAADFIDYDRDAMAAGLAASTVDYGTNTSYPEGVETTSGMRNVLSALADAGWSNDELERIAWRNQLEFIERVLAV